MDYRGFFKKCSRIVFPFKYCRGIKFVLFNFFFMEVKRSSSTVCSASEESESGRRRTLIRYNFYAM